MSSTLQTVTMDSIRIQPQVRKLFDLDSIKGLAESIVESGLQQPLLCGQDSEGIWLIDGERRYRACKQLGWAKIPILIESAPLEVGEAVARQLVCNLQREGLSVLERAEGIKQLIEQTSMTAEQAAKKLGMSAASVSRTLAVLKLPDRIRAQVANGRISADTAYLLARVEETEYQSSLASEVAEGKLSRDALARKLKRIRRGEDLRRAGVSRVTAALGLGRTVTLAGSDLTLETLIEWLEPLIARAKKSHKQGLTLQTFIRTLKDQASA